MVKRGSNRMPRGPRARLARPALLAALLGLALVPAAAAAQTDGTVQPRIVGGTTASVAQYPWQAAVVFTGSGNAHQRQFCGGSLLTSRIVITAAHCVYDLDPDCNSLGGQGTCLPSDPGGDGTKKLDPNDVNVVLGYSTLSTAPASAEIPVDTVTFDSQYSPNYNNDGVPENDVAFLVLHTASAQTQIKIAGSDEGALWDPGSLVEISGWGSTSESGGTQDTLRAATVQVIADSSCDSPLAYGTDFEPATMLCAGYMSGGVDTCFGDSGGPLEAPLEGGGYRLVGVTSWGDGCARAGLPGVYTRVADSTMRSRIASDISVLPTGTEQSVGSGGMPRSSLPGSNQAASPTVSPFAKCKRIHNKKKRRRCNKKVRALLRAQV
jgi:secreted trypsin-like serine protease